MHQLHALGWTPFFDAQFQPYQASGLVPARVMEEQRNSFRIATTPDALHQAELTGKLRRDASLGSRIRPCTGDWVAAALPEHPGGLALIHHVLERRTCFSRQEAGTRTAEQVVAANVDTVFLVQSLNQNFNVRRIERYLALLWESGAEPVVVLSKADVCADPAPRIEEAERAARGVSVLTVSAVREGGVEPLRPYLAAGRTVALVGSSGVGKSTLVNALMGEELMDVQGIREDGRGRHTTTSRHLVALPSGGLLLDTPGMRTVLLWAGEEGIARTFDDVDAVAKRCRFRDCTHRSEPGCAVREALESGELDRDRMRSYEKLEREARHHAAKVDPKVRRELQRQWRAIHLEARRRPDKRAF
ncbi:MAG TPA: ribosome small subunit-dependent GTPase A [Candidatus Eisenbacteria bacterium]|nr:ribosome small subunit-dependent GTPase A [Candidatus Eisenbacteria bacterium]